MDTVWVPVHSFPSRCLSFSLEPPSPELQRPQKRLEFRDTLPFSELEAGFQPSSIPDSNSAPLLSSQSRSFSVGHYPSPQTSPNSKPTFAPSDPTASQPPPQQQSTPVWSGKRRSGRFETCCRLDRENLPHPRTQLVLPPY